MTTFGSALLVCLSGLVSTVATVADTPNIAVAGQGDPWLWSTGDFVPDRGLANDGVPGAPEPVASDAA